jgi:DNA-binding transcriptional LysR family regulator
MDRISAMQVFAKVVELGSFARAAERMNLSTSAASRQIAELESHLDTRLLNRTTRKISLTEPGRAYHERCLQLLADIDEAEQAAQAGRASPRGTLRVTCSVNFGVHHLAPLLGPFQKKHPQVQLDISLSDRMVDIVEEGFDLAIRIGESRSTSVIARKLGETRMVCCAAPAYLKQHGTPKTPQQLASHNCLIYEYLNPRNEWRFIDKHGREHKARVFGTTQTNNGDLLATVAAQGLGICCEPDFIVAAHLASGRLKRILPDFVAPITAIHAVYPSRRHLSAKVRMFVDMLATAFAREAETTAKLVSVR